MLLLKRILKRMVDVKMSFKSGFVTVVGRPNVGKSTLLNALLGQKLLIVSDKPQATRNQIQCVLNGDDYQVVFLDTPGIHKPHHQLGEILVATAKQSLQDVDLILFMIEPEYPIGKGDRFVAEILKKVDTPVVLCVNKIDQIKKVTLIPVLDEWHKTYNFAEIIPISARTGEGLESLKRTIKNYLQEGPKYYPDDMLTDKSERFIIAEMIREKVFHFTHEEVPYSVAVDIRQIEEHAQAVYIPADIIVERDSQKGIIIGKQGQMIRKIRQKAAADIKKLLGCEVDLDLHVRTKSDWRNRIELLEKLGYQRE